MTRSIPACTKALIQGPKSISALQYQVEPQLVKLYQPDSLGYIWAALASFMRAAANSPQPAPSDIAHQKRPKRVSSKPREYRNFVSSNELTFGSSQDSRHRASSVDSYETHETHESIGYVEKPTDPLIEDATIRLASCFIRYVLNPLFFVFRMFLSQRVRVLIVPGGV
ncbi:hypothetical protein CP533_1942 [Ophiocordyceps camponoti-saundersi (nom. inval.)]|nr:hypothetical protein CP533_1942 [Ophiocordyceps camponoti-saundersi (nom. inval.)]